MFTTPFIPGHFGPALSNELAPLFRLLDSATADLVPSSARNGPARRHFTPRFDVREVGQAYELQGELPGIEQKDLDIEFVDERTLVIRGRTASEHTTAPATEAETGTNKAVEAGEATATSDDASDHSTTTYHKPSVEEEDGYVDAGAESSADGAKTPATENTNAKATEVAHTEKNNQTVVQPNHKYWVSERSVGEFERRFSFPGRVDQEAVKASLRNGILSVVVPKIVAREARRIQVE